MSIMERIEQLIAQGAPLTLPQILRNEINEFRGSQDYANILEARGPACFCPVSSCVAPFHID